MADRAIIVINSIRARDQIVGWARRMPKGTIVEFRKPVRSLEQNSRLWAMLTDVSKQVEWYGEKLSAQDFKDIFTAALKRHKVVPGIDGGFVVLGTHTSRMTVAELSELMDLIEAFGAQHGVVWSNEERHTAERHRPYREAGVEPFTVPDDSELDDEEA